MRAYHAEAQARKANFAATLSQYSDNVCLLRPAICPAGGPVGETLSPSRAKAAGRRGESWRRARASWAPARRSVAPTSAAEQDGTARRPPTKAEAVVGACGSRTRRSRTQRERAVVKELAALQAQLAEAALQLEALRKGGAAARSAGQEEKVAQMTAKAGEMEADSQARGRGGRRRDARSHQEEPARDAG